MKVARRQALRLRAVASTLLLWSGGCSAGTSRPDWPPSPAVVDVRMSEYAFSYPPAIPAGRVVFRARNSGSLDHELQLFPLADDIPPINDQLRGSQRRVLNAVAGVPRRDPGESGLFSVELVAGQRYALICFLVDGGKPHATEGMNAEFRPAGA